MRATVSGCACAKSSVNQRATTASATACVPPSRTVAARSTQGSGSPKRADVQSSARVLARSGA